MSRLANLGLRYSQFHTTALCSPTRACLLTGRNATSNGMACISEFASGYPGANARIPFENATADSYDLWVFCNNNIDDCLFSDTVTAFY